MNLADFSRLLARALERNMPLPEALAFAADAVPSRRLKKTIQNVRCGVLEGKSLDEAMEAYPRTFSVPYRAIVKAGLASGNLPNVLAFIHVWDEAKTKMRRIILPMLGYVGAMVVVVCGILLALRGVAQEFMEMFQEFGMMLALPTRMVFALLTHIHIAMAIVVLTPAAIYLMWRLLFRTSPAGRIVYAVPIIGKVMKAVSMARFCTIAGALLEAGQTTTSAVRLCADAEPNRHFREILGNVGESIAEGEGLSDATIAEEFFPRVLALMTLAGEKHGRLPEALRSTGEIHVGRIEGLAIPFANALVPLAFVLVGALVGFFVMALYMPMFGIMGSM